MVTEDEVGRTGVCGWTGVILPCGFDEEATSTRGLIGAISIPSCGCGVVVATDD